MSIFYTEQEIQNLGFNPVGKIKEEDENKSSIFFTEEEIQEQKELRSTDFVEPEPVLVQTEQLLQKEREEAPTEPQSMQSLYEDDQLVEDIFCLLYTSPSPRDRG